MLIFISVILGVFIHESTNHKCDHLLEGFGATRSPEKPKKGGKVLLRVVCHS